MRVITLNLNGIRSATKKGVFDWFAHQEADIICVQETRAPEALLQTDAYQLPGYHCFYQSAQRGGYSGVGILSRQKPKQVVRQLGFALADEEGRYIHVEFDHLVVASLYMPSGTSGEARQTLKYEFMDRYAPILDACLQSGKPHIIAGDWNIAHQKIDLKNWRSNQKNSGFLPQERAYLDQLLAEKKWVDAFRVVNQESEQYTWWSHRGRAWEKNVGWRIDYQMITPDLKTCVQSAHIYKDERFSDHAPLVIDYAIPSSIRI